MESKFRIPNSLFGSCNYLHSQTQNRGWEGEVAAGMFSWPGDGSAGEGGRRGGSGHWETGAEPSLLLWALWSLCSLMNPSNKWPGSLHRFPHLHYAHWATSPARPGQAAPLPHQAQLSLRMPITCTPCQQIVGLCSLFFSLLSSFSWLYEELQFTSRGQKHSSWMASAKNSLAHGLPHTPFGASFSHGAGCHGGGLGGRQQDWVPGGESVSAGWVDAQLKVLTGSN